MQKIQAPNIDAKVTKCNYGILQDINLETI